MKTSGYSPKVHSPRVCCRQHKEKSERDLGKRCNHGLRAGENAWHKQTWLNLLSQLEMERWLPAMSVYLRKWGASASEIAQGTAQLCSTVGDQL